MASAKLMPAVTAAKPGKRKKIDEWDARDAMHTLMRAGEIIADKPLLEAARKAASEQAVKSAAVAKQATRLAKMGHISPKALAKLAVKA